MEIGKLHYGNEQLQQPDMQHKTAKSSRSVTTANRQEMITFPQAVLLNAEK